MTTFDALSYTISLINEYAALGKFQFNIVPSPSLFSNLLVLDWSAYNTDYLQSLSYMHHIANVIGDKLHEMSQDSDNQLNLSNFHFVGLSLRAHMVGIIARRIKIRDGEVAKQ